MPESCYFYIDTDLPLSEQKVKPICLECHDKSASKVGSYWDGSNGYGPFDFICATCGKVIYKGTEDIDD